MAKVRKHFTVTKHLPNKAGSIEFSGIIYNNDVEQYDIEDVRLHTTCNGKPVVEENTQFFHMMRNVVDAEFYHSDICELLIDWLMSDEAINHRSPVNEYA